MIGQASCSTWMCPCPAANVTASPRRRRCSRHGCDAGRSLREPSADETARALLRRLALDDGMELWVAEAQRGDCRRGSSRTRRGARNFAGIWGELPSQRGAARNLPGTYRCTGPVSASGGKDPHPQRLDRILPSHPRAIRVRQGLHNNPVPLESIRTPALESLIWVAENCWIDKQNPPIPTVMRSSSFAYLDTITSAEPVSIRRANPTRSRGGQCEPAPLSVSDEQEARRARVRGKARRTPGPSFDSHTAPRWRTASAKARRLGSST